MHSGVFSQVGYPLVEFSKTSPIVHFDVGNAYLGLFHLQKNVLHTFTNFCTLWYKEQTSNRSRGIKNVNPRLKHNEQINEVICDATLSKCYVSALSALVRCLQSVYISSLLKTSSIMMSNHRANWGSLQGIKANWILLCRWQDALRRGFILWLVMLVGWPLTSGSL